MLVRAFIFSMLFFLCACAGAKRDYIKLEKKSYSNLDHWKNDKHEEALKAYVKSCSSHKKILNAEIFKSAPKQAIQASLIRTCKLAKQTKNPKKFFEDNFVNFELLIKFEDFFEFSFLISSLKSFKYFKH